MFPRLINIIENAAKTIIYIWIALVLFLVTYILFFDLSGKSVSFGFNCFNFGFLVNIALLALILISIYAFFMSYRKATQK